MSSASTLGEREDGIPRLSGVTATVLTATVAAAAAQAATTAYILALAATAIVIPALIWVVGRTRPADALPLGFALALVAVTAAFSALAGPHPSVWIACYAPFLVLATGTFGAGVAFAVADAVVLVWAVLAGLAAGGLLPGTGELPQGPGAIVVALVASALFLNGVVLTLAWTLGARDPVRTRELMRLAGERDRLADQLAQLEPLAASGRLVANVAHEVSNPLQAMHHVLHVLLEDTPAPDSRRDQLLLLKGATERIAEYLEQLSDFYRPSGEAGPTDVNSVLGDVCRFLERQLGNANVKLSQDLAEGLPPAAIGESPLRQSLLNVILNGVEAMERGGELSVSTARTTQGIQVIVRDTGRGIASEELEHVFEPFFSGRHSAGGTGLGLTLSQRTLRRCGGDVRVASTLGIGTEVTLELPAMEG